MTNQELSTLNINIDKNIAFNIKELRREDDKQTEQIIKSLLIYFNLSSQEDLFGFRTLDPYHFCEIMGFSRENLFRKHPNPEYQKSLNYNPTNNYLWDNYLTNALYILSSKPIFGEYKGISNDFDYIGFHNFIIIKEIQFFTKKVRNTQKHFFKYLLDETFEKNIYKFFLKTNINLFVECKRKNVEDFYLYISNIYNAYKGKENKYYFTLDELCNFFYVSKEIEKKKRKEKIKKYLERIKEILNNQIKGLDFIWEKTYVPIMTWEKLDEQTLRTENNIAINESFYRLLRRKLYDLYLNQYNGLPDDDSFFHWIKDYRSNEVKKACYIMSFTSIHNIKGNSDKIILYSNEFLKIINNLNSKEDLNAFWEKTIYNIEMKKIK